MNPVRLSTAVALLALPLLLSACGNKGPLILPPKNVPQIVMPSDAPSAQNAQDAQQIGDSSDSLDQAPKAGDSNAETDLKDDSDSDPPENTDIP
jgi:predicted small lipoprotein YifL